MTKLAKSISFLFLFVLAIGSTLSVFSQNGFLRNEEAQKRVVFGNKKLQMTLEYGKKAVLSSVIINGQEVVAQGSGLYSGIRTSVKSYSTLSVTNQPLLSTGKNSIVLKNIKYGEGPYSIIEDWKFTITDNNIQLDIDRLTSNNITVEKAEFPAINFNSMDVWEGAYQDYGGLAWFYLFNKQQDTYGVHSQSSRFWNSKTNNGLSVEVVSPGQQIAMDYSRTKDNKLAYTVAVSSKEIIPRFDSGTHRRRYVRDTTDIWSPVTINAGKIHQRISFSPFDFEERFGRGRLVGVNQDQVSAVLNTIARIGVIDKKHFGGNSWHTPYGPICLHEQYIAQMGLGINDPAYLKGYRECLDFYRDNAIKPDGRVWPRWAYSNEDAMPKAYTDKGFYEAQWGYLLDANPDLVTNIAELYNQNGDLAWVKTHQQSCEKALEWLMKRDENGNALVEMMTDSHKQKRGSDWIDIIWAAYENAFVNAKLYRALVLWTAIEKQLGNTKKEKYYREFAEKLKTNFNKSTTEGGFWDAEKKCYIHWRDKDGSIHGNNMVTPVNFMAIAYGICDDKERTKTILDDIETQMVKEDLFFWPLCLYSYALGEGNDWQFPFANYENGDIFLSWGSVAVKAYASYKPELAVKYVNKVLAQYAKDGLAFQRYGRAKQDGLGDDILSGNCLSVVGLYQAVYGINPMYNRFYLDPHITSSLNGTQVRYVYRDKPLLIDLNMNRYSVSDKRFKITAPSQFGFFSSGNELFYFNGDSEQASMKLFTTAKGIDIEIGKWSKEEIRWTQSTHSATLKYQINGLVANSNYTVRINQNIQKRIKTSAAGILEFEASANMEKEEVVVSQN